MAYQNLFKALENVCGFTALETDILEIINAYEKDKSENSAWVSVDDALPPPLQTVWLTNGKGFVCLGCLVESDEGYRAIIFSSVHYDFLLEQGVTMPDYKMYLRDAAAIFNQKDKNETTVSESINLVLRNNIRGEAKRIALQQLFQQLKESGKTLADYIKSSQEFNNAKTK